MTRSKTRSVRADSARHNASFPDGHWSDIKVTLTDGRTLHSGDVAASGGPDAWRTDAEVEEKFHSFCGSVLPENRIRAIWAMRDALLDPGMKFADLAALVQPSVAA